MLVIDGSQGESDDNLEAFIDWHPNNKITAENNNNVSFLLLSI